MTEQENPNIKSLEEQRKKLETETEEILNPNNGKQPLSSENGVETSAAENSSDNNTTPQENNGASQQNSGTAQEKEQTQGTADGLDEFNVGMSNAYAGVLTPQKKDSTKSKVSSWPTPPENKKSKVKVADGKDIMEVFWNEMWSWIDSAIDWTVDRCLDLLTFALFPSAPEVKEKKEVKKADAFKAGQTAYESIEKKIKANIKKATDSHAEMLKNLELASRGEKTEWTINSKEPEKFQQLLEISKKAKADPNSEEAKKLDRFTKVPDILKKTEKNALNVLRIACNENMMKEQLKSKTKGDAIKDVREKYKNDKKKLKEELEKINEIYANPEKQEELMTQSIIDGTEKSMPILYENINKIREKYKANPEKMKETLTQYMGEISSALKDATTVIYDEIYNKGNDSDKTRKKGEENLGKLTKAILNFTLDDKPINEVQKAQNETNVNVANWTQQDISKIITHSVNGRK